MTREVSIVVSCDDHYIVLLAALLKSIEANLAKDVIIHFYIVEDKVSERNKKKISRSANPAIFKFKWITTEDAVPNDMQLPLDRSSFPLNVYMRLFIPYFVPADLDKVLFMDVDMIAQHDISELYDTNMENHILAAVQDPRIVTFDNSWGGVLNYQELGLRGDHKYFNAGIYVVNTKKWREADITRKVVDCINANRKYANYPDQYGLNILLADQWKELDPRWNNFADHEIADPYVIHFVERKPIFKSYKYSERYQKFFFEYLNQTEWKGFRPKGDMGRYVKKIWNLAEKFLLAWKK